MPNLWADKHGEQYVNKKATDLLDHLDDRRIFDDDGWVTLADIQTELKIAEYHAYGIVMYLWLQDKIETRPDDSGKLTIRIFWLEK